MKSVEETSDAPDSRANVSQQQQLIPTGHVEITTRQSFRPSGLPSLNPSCLEVEANERADFIPGFRANRGKQQLQVFLPRTPSSPCQSPYSGPWHGRHSDSGSGSSSSSPASSKSSPASNKSSPGSVTAMGFKPSPNSSITISSIEQALGDSKAFLQPGVTNETPRLTRRHTYPRCSVLQELAHASKKSGAPPLPPPIPPQENRQKQEPEEVFVRANSLEESVTLQQPGMVSYFLEQGVDPNGEVESSKVSPLIIAASAGNEKIVKLLLAAGARTDVEDASRGTALHHAAAGGHRGVVKLLLVAGADMFHKTSEGQLPVQLTDDSRIRHLLTCRMRSSSDQSLESAKSVVLSSRSVRAEAPGVQPAPYHIPPLPRNELGFVETTMQKISPRSESPRRPVDPKRDKLKELEKEEGVSQRRRSSIVLEEGEDESWRGRGKAPSPSSSVRSISGKRDSPEPEKQETNGRRRSVQFVEAGKIESLGKQPVATEAEAKQPVTTEAEAKQPGTTETEAKASTSEGSAEKLFPVPEPRTTPGGFKWTKGELLGEGAYGKVFSGLNQSTGELMAVKQLKIEAGEEDKAVYLAAMEREINMYKNLRHKHIVGYINMEQDEKNDCLYIFLEYVSGGSIQSMLERFGRFSENLVRVYTRQLLLGLQYLHENRIVHRDIKGGNVLVDALGVIKLADFGASKSFHDPTVTNECKSIRGSVFWMAPEVIKGDGYGRRADIWSVGCTVIEMLTAMHPWPDIDNTWSAIFHIAKASSGPPLPPAASDCATDFLQQCFQLDPLLRPTATQLLEHRFVAMANEEH